MQDRLSRNPPTRLLLGALAAELGLVLTGLTVAAVLPVAALAFATTPGFLRRRAGAVDIP